MGKKQKHKQRSPISLPTLSTGGEHIPPAPQLHEGTVRFSFKHIDLISNPKFSLVRCDNVREYVERLIDRLKAINGMTPNEFRFSGSDALRCHEIDWVKTSETNGFRHLNRQLRDNTPWQFNVSLNAYGRVHGFFINNTFFIVWIDPKPLLYS